MVFTTVINFVRSKGPDEFWRKRKIFKMAAHFVGRRRNCYSIAIRNVHRALAYATKGRQLKKQDMIDLWKTQIDAGSQQHGLSYNLMKEGLIRSNILLNKKTLADLAIWEPYTFKALTQIAAVKVKEEKMPLDDDTEIPENVITRGLLSK
ncbi:39S ribosomal protein L20, mitochondrial [Cimex lectularius]|uniref:Large ribosomal subunit protein bL20m n=1 Tax=Cimex lectularius TaxID=79782 RepID=A0A8I6RG21_CIMLE|nr:39S ribosomal protein L20, mitochondrial [Cimex lectularius]